MISAFCVANIAHGENSSETNKYRFGQEKLGPKSIFNRTCELPQGWKVPANSPVSYYFDNCSIPEKDMPYYCEEGCVTSEVGEKGTGHLKGVLLVNGNQKKRRTSNLDLDFWAPAGTSILAPKGGQVLYFKSSSNTVKMPVPGNATTTGRKHNIAHLQKRLFTKNRKR